MTIEEKINQLAEKKKAFLDMQDKFNAETADIQDEIKELESDVRMMVIDLGKSVKTDLMSVSYNKGRTTWDSTLLDGYCLAHPELLSAKKVGQPTVSFRLFR